MRGVSRILLLSFFASIACAQTIDLWTLAKSKKDVHVFSTLFTAQNVRDMLSTGPGIDKAIDWCRKTGVTKVYLETFRTTYQADRPVLANAKQKFADAGFDVSGCVTTTRVGKISNGWNLISCYTDRATQDKLQAVFEYTAGLFDEIMIDDFWFTDCSCAECDQARRARTVRVGEKDTQAAGDTWEDYRRELMTRVSRERILEPARRVNPRVKLIIKYPQWYDRFHERGYDVDIQTRDFDKIWVGTETRDVGPKNGKPQYEAYFIMRWLGGIGGVATLPDWRRHGYAGAAMRTAAEFMRNELRVEFGLLICGDQMLPYYCKLGWQLIAGPLMFDQPKGKTTFDASTKIMVLPSRKHDWPPGVIDLCGPPW